LKVEDYACAAVCGFVRRSGGHGQINHRLGQVLVQGCVPVGGVLFEEGFEVNLLQLVDVGEASARGGSVVGVDKGAADMVVLVACQAADGGHYGAKSRADNPSWRAGLPFHRCSAGIHLRNDARLRAIVRVFDSSIP